MRTLITGGTVVNATGRSRADVLIDGEQIAAVLAPGSTLLGFDVAAHVDTVIDATGKYVIPGGIDAHTHMEMPFGGTFASDTFETGTVAAAWGGTTTIVDFVVQYPGQNPLEQYALWHEKAAGRCAVDYGFHQILSDIQDSSLDAMDELVAEGVTSFKVFTAYKGVFLSDDGQILKAMQRAAANGAMIMGHAENGSVIDVLVQQALGRGETSPSTTASPGPGRPRRRPPTGSSCWRTSPARRCTSCTSRPSRPSSRSPPPATGARTSSARPARSTSTSPSRSSSGAPGFEGAKWVCSTPLRSRAEGHQHHMWQSLRTNDLQVVSTDHCPFCMKDQKEMGLGDFSKIPNGIGGGRAPHGPALPGRRHRGDLARAVGGAVLRDAGPDVRHVRPARVSSPRAPTPTSSSTTRTATRASGWARPTT